MVRPNQLCTHNYWWLVAAIAHYLLACTAPVRLMKARAHIGVQGNEAPDRLASFAHDDPSISASPFQNPQSLAWGQFWFGEEISDLDTLHDHALVEACNA